MRFNGCLAKLARPVAEAPHRCSCLDAKRSGRAFRLFISAFLPLAPPCPHGRHTALSRLSYGERATTYRRSGRDSRIGEHSSIQTYHAYCLKVQRVDRAEEPVDSQAYISLPADLVPLPRPLTTGGPLGTRGPALQETRWA